MTDERALKLAAKIAKELFDQTHFQRDAERVALAAIKATTQLAAEWIEREQPGYIERCDDPAMAAANHYAGGLEEFAHLPADGGENV
ncbi:hypothetical protein BSL82_09425 [Tardibacter chloracetimidivorans]|uniref:Uncharacterized protein n=1 Tax=Tardibacter chloracetimidivorans TaxID=1921510 RepID=A0A1L3ZV73_9SPHN|nr:hypothetical protein [Tardibacter chloracetimidivorans]API59500.1 hypothetical protein BSL82_09425 [Tardibacter chloracetimidivorans]